MKDRIIVSCCYSETRAEYYQGFAARLESSLDKFAPDTKRNIWRSACPPGSPSHSQLHYAFKYWAVNHEVQNGHQYVMWLDAGTEVLASLGPLWERIERDGYVLV